jgi:signal peptidase II
MKQRIRHFLLVIILIILDQLSKWWVRDTLMNKKPIVIISDVFKLQYHENTGAVWGIMSGKVELLALLSIIIFLFLTFLYIKIPNEKKYNALKLILVFIMAGAIGNMIDRIFLKHVVDFIYFEIINFPLFNVADCYVTVSSVLLIILSLFYYKDNDFDFIEHMFQCKNNKAVENNDKENQNKKDSKEQ